MHPHPVWGTTNAVPLATTGDAAHPGHDYLLSGALVNTRGLATFLRRESALP
jgi:hypothetical protein